MLNLELIARLSLGLLLLGAAVIGLPHRVRADRAGGHVSRSHDPAWFWNAMRFVGPSFLLAIVMYAIDPRWLDWSAVALPAWLRLAGVPVGLLALAGFKWMFVNLGANVTSTSQPRDGATLVTSGPYRWVRHPMYVVVAVLSLAVTLLTANWLIGALGAATVALLAARSSVEERRLVEKFGDAYRDYQRTTGRFVPSLRR